MRRRKRTAEEEEEEEEEPSVPSLALAWAPWKSVGLLWFLRHGGPEAPKGVEGSLRGFPWLPWLPGSSQELPGPPKGF